MEILQKAHFSPEDVEADEVLLITPVKLLQAVRCGILQKRDLWSR